MQRYIFLAALLMILFLPTSLLAQEETEADTVDMGILLRREMSGNLMVHTMGYGLGYRIGSNKTFFKNRMFEFDLLEMKAPNQQKRYNDNFPNPRSYYYSKLNSLYILRAGIGQQRLLNRKPYWGGVEVRMFYYGGLSAGLAKPTYLYIAYYTYNPSDEVTYYSLELERYDPAKHFPYRGQNPDCDCDIYGRGPLLSGFNHIKPYPGIYAKLGFNFEFSQANDRIKALETGITVDAFPKPIPMMAFDDPYHFFLTGYLSFHLGKRYN